MMFVGFVDLNKEENPGHLKKVSLLGRGEHRNCDSKQANCSELSARLPGVGCSYRQGTQRREPLLVT